MSQCCSSTISLFVMLVGSSAALRRYPKRSLWGLHLVVALGHQLCTKVAMGSHTSQSSCLADMYSRMYCLTHWFLHSVSLSVCGWKVVLIFRPMLSFVIRACAKWEVNHGSQSDITFEGTLNHGNRCLRYRRATPSPVMFVWQGRKMAALEHPWSTMVRIGSCLLACGNWVMRSRVTMLNGCIDGSPGMQKRGVFLLLVHILFC